MATTRIQIGPADHGRQMTLDEFREAEEEPGYRYELARGVLEVTEVPKTRTGRSSSNLVQAIGRVLRPRHPGVIRLLRQRAGRIPALVAGR